MCCADTVPPVILLSHLNRGRLEELVAEHLDHLYYIKDILSLGVDSLNTVLTDQLLNRLLIPLYVYSITDHSPFPEGVSHLLMHLPLSPAHCFPPPLHMCVLAVVCTAREPSDQQYRGSVSTGTGTLPCTTLSSQHSTLYSQDFISPRVTNCAMGFPTAQVFLILSGPAVVLPLAYVILTGDTSVSLPDLLKQSSLVSVLSPPARCLFSTVCWLEWFQCCHLFPHPPGPSKR